MTVIISKYKNIFEKGYTSNLSEDVFVIKKVKKTVPWTSWSYCGGNCWNVLRKRIDKNKLKGKFKKQSKEKTINHMLNGKVMIHNLIVGYIKKSISEYQGHK